jgi:acyl-CoA synthetase (NDP forming)
MATLAQITANQANSQLSTGAKSAEGKAAVSQNNFRHGFTGAFKLLPCEDTDAFRKLHSDLCEQHQPGAGFETTLVEKMAQHFWLVQRAVSLQESCFNPESPACDNDKQLALYLRYQTTHDRAFYKCADELRKLRQEKRKAEIGFESQEHKRNEEARRQAEADRKQHLHTWRVLQLQAEVDHQTILNANIAPEGWDLNKGIRRIEAAEKAA